MSKNLSIVIPILNEESKIKDNLSYFDLLRKNCELIFVDGGSKDCTVSLLKNNNQNVITSPYVGRGAQLSFGAENTNKFSKYLLFLHVDSRLPDNFMELINDHLNNHEWGRFNTKLDSNKFICKVITCSMNLRSHITGIATGDQAIFVAKNSYLEHINAMKNHPIMEDIYLSKILKKKHGYPAVIKSHVTTSARYWLKNGIMRTIIRMWKFRLLYFFGASPKKLYKLYYH